ncbi:ATP-dependent DNA ligase [Microbacterium schleiferi]|uniref:DNA ligase (ATP) n=1 Tax=Microbacterium schleiferi TaxID=69362 RepID=A0A7S8RGW0_9MICO|nr:ATP-dependent DNA ligase [Microbacterium schleiferi]QPE03681.1 ATP-dependent DNA ligase [Microbacterium schleiferi]
MAGREQTVQVQGHRLRLTNLDKVLYPSTGTTKGEVIDYYSRIAPAILPALAGRPVTRKRWPDGVGDAEHPGMSFFTKDLERGAPEWLARMPIEHSSGTKTYPLIDSQAALVWLGQVASLELHVPQWRFSGDGTPANPDRLVLDLDPGPEVGLAECAEVARLVRDILLGMSLEAVPVTSGSKGIHLYAPLPGTLTSGGASNLARELARALETDHPDLVVSSMSKAARPGKVFLDWSQNNGKKTTISPYSLRGREHPTVAAPRTWEELAEPDLRQLLFTEVLERAAADIARFLGQTGPTPDAGSAPLDRYREKRDAARTPEPVPERGAPPEARADEAAPRFVVQEHHASRLHFDLRLERDGVLVSWAVPRGIPETPDRNNLAVMTEDHPLEYLTFHGTIPKGQYGAGTMTVWDTGTYETEKWRADEIIVRTHGTPGGAMDDARFALIRTEGDGEKSQWLLHRMKDAAPGTTPAPPTVRRSRETPDHHGSLAPMLATPATPGLAAGAITRWGGEPWVEMKWDGIRAVGSWDGTALTLRARSGNDLTATYPDLQDAALGTAPCVVDGEIVALDERGRPSFPLLQKRMNLAKPTEITREVGRTPVRYYLFDLLEIDGQDATALPLADRRALLERLADGAADRIAVPPVFDDLDATLAAAREADLEGVVVKNPASRYRPGERSPDWVKIKLTRTQDVVIGGIRPGQGGRSGTIGSLLVGIPGPDGLHYAGRVGTGFTDASLTVLGRLLAPLGTDEMPFVGVPAADARDAIWVRPELVGEVEFAEFTPGGILRHARWRGLRPDRSPDDVVLEDTP